MAKMLITKTLLTSIADAIRGKTGKTDTMTPAEMVTEVSNIISVQDWLDDKVSEIDCPTATDFIAPEHHALKKVSVTQGTSIGKYSFYNCDRITNFSAPNTTRVAAYGLGECSSITSIDFDSTLTQIDQSGMQRIGLAYGNFPLLKYVGENGLCLCPNLTTLVAPKLKYTGESAFLRCGKLTSVLCNNLESINNNAFQECVSLTKVDFPKATKIGSWAFKDCEKLAELGLGDITSLGTSANTVGFALQELLVRSTYLDSYGFGYINTKRIVAPLLESSRYQLLKNTSNVQVFDMLGSSSNRIPSDADGLFDQSEGSAPGFEAWIIRQADGVQPIATDAKTVCGKGSKISNGTGYVYVPSALISDYETATNWASLAGQFRAIEDYTVDGTLTGDMDYDKMGVTFND